MAKTEKAAICLSGGEASSGLSVYANNLRDPTE